MKDRLDFILSNWIFIWFLLFYLNIIKFPNPKFSLIIGLMFNVPVIIILIYKNRFNDIKKIYPYLIFLLFTKIIPLYLLRKDKIQLIDIIAFGILFIINILYIYLQAGDIRNIYNLIKERLNKGLNGNINGSITK